MAQTGRVPRRRAAMTTEQPSEDSRRDALVGRLLQEFQGATDIFAIYLGHRLGYYEALREEAATAPALAQRTLTNARYAREWLEQQAASGLLDGEADSAASEHR